MDTGYAWQKFSAAVDALASMPDPLQERVRMAFNSICQLQIDDIPQDLREPYQEIRQAYYDGKSVRTLTEDEQSRLASKIVTFFDHICRRQRS